MSAISKSLITKSEALELCPDSWDRAHIEQSYMDMPKKLVEYVARELCKHGGDDPDEDWRDHIPAARLAIATVRLFDSGYKF